MVNENEDWGLGSEEGSKPKAVLLPNILRVVACYN